MFRSPWQHNLHVRTVALVRRLLRPFPGLEQRYIEGLVHRQNRHVHDHLSRRAARTVLLIMPRCVGRRGCCPDAGHDLASSRDCHACPLGDVARLCEAYGVRALVAFRSHIAYELARKEKPDLIIATACHDRLVKALRSVPEVPALLAPLAGMEKMCVNAEIDLDWLEDQLRRVTTASPETVPADRHTDPLGTP